MSLFEKSSAKTFVAWVCAISARNFLRKGICDALCLSPNKKRRLTYEYDAVFFYLLTTPHSVRLKITLPVSTDESISKPKILFNISSSNVFTATVAVVNFKHRNELRCAGDKIKGYGVKLACKPYPFVLDPAHVVGVKFTRLSC